MSNKTSPTMPSFTRTWHNKSYPAISPQRPELSAKGKNVIITGAGSGIGARTVLSFAEAGAANIAILGRTEHNLIETQTTVRTRFPDVAIYTFVADITKLDEVKRAFSNFSEAVQQGGAGGKGETHVLVSNAGYAAASASIAEMDLNEWSRSLDVNLMGSVNVAHAFIQVAASDAAVINVASAITYVNFTKDASPYAVSKAAAVRFFDCLQQEHPDFHVFNIQPGVVDTPMSRKTGYQALDDSSLPADFMVWLSSPEAAFAKGKYLWTNWDVDEMKAKAEQIANSRLLTMNLEGWPFADNM